MDTVIELKNVSKSFGKRSVLKNISLKINRGNIVGIVGRNGSGKTVLLKCICGFMTPNKGEIRIRGKLLDAKHDVTGNMGILIESPGFLENDSAEQNLMYLANINRFIGRDQVRASISDVGLDPDDKKKVKKYSMGMRQRLGIAQAVMEGQDIILLDEPMNGLDENGVASMRKRFLDLKKEGRTIVLVSHNKEDIAILCDEIYKIDNGSISVLSTVSA